MAHYTCVRAVNAEQLHDSLVLREHCLSAMGLKCSSVTGPRRELDDLDELSTTSHILVYAERDLAATARLTRPHPELARRTGGVGLELALAYDLSGFASRAVAEVSKVFVRPEHRKSLAVFALFHKMTEVSRQEGIDEWLGGVDTATANPGKAATIYDYLLEIGRVARDPWLEPRDASSVAAARASSGQSSQRCDWLRLRHAPAIHSFCRHLGAICVGPPARHMHHDRQILPLVAYPKELPERTLATFASLSTS